MGAGEVAPIVGKQGPTIDLAVRNNTRVMWDDEAEASELLERVASAVPETFEEGQLVGANPRLRLYRYDPGEKHGVHRRSSCPAACAAGSRWSSI